MKIVYICVRSGRGDGVGWELKGEHCQAEKHHTAWSFTAVPDVHLAPHGFDLQEGL